MAFTWNSVSAGTELKADDINQARTHINTLTTNMGLSQYSWTEMPVTADVDETMAVQLSELQDAVDYIDTNNVCSSYNAAKYTTVYSTKDTTIDATAYTTVDNDQHFTFNSGVDNLQDSIWNAAVDSDQHLTYYGTRNASVDATAYGTVKSVN